MNIKKNKPISVVLELTRKCNMNCMHCGSSAGKTRSNELTIKEIAHVINEAKKLKCKYITLIGGEPFLRKDWFEISKIIRAQGIELSIVSNGFNLDNNIISNLKKLQPYTIGISLDGACSTTHDTIRGLKGSFNKCIESINALRKENINVTVITTLHKGNIQELPRIREILLNKGIAWQIQMALPIGRFDKNFLLSQDEFYSAAMFISSTQNRFSIKEMPVVGAHNFGYHSKILRNIMLNPLWKGCPAGISTVGIQSDGGIKGCLSLPDEYIEDNIRNKGLAEIWNDSDAFSYNRKFLKKDLSGKCTSCKHGKSCKGGCMSVSTSITGKEHCNPYCLYLIESNKIIK